MEQIAITGATGNIGFRVAQGLLNSGVGVRAISRNPDSPRIKELTSLGATFSKSTLDDVKTLRLAFSDCKAALVMTPAEYTSLDFRQVQIACADAIASALKSAKVAKVVSVSGLGADLNQETGVVRGLFHFEQQLNQLSADVLHLRATYFMENFFHLIYPIRQLGFAASPMKGGIPIPMIATKDVADRALDVLFSRNFKGKSHLDLLGPEDVKIEMAVKSLGEAIGKPKLKHMRLPDHISKKGIQMAGNSENLARLSILMHKAFYSGLIKYDRIPASSTPTTIQDFARTFAEKYSQSSVRETPLAKLVYKSLSFL